MTDKLIQKHLLKGTQELEIGDEVVNVRTRTHLKEEALEVLLTVLDPEPVQNGSYLEFRSRVNGEALISLQMNKPDAQAFDAFVETLKGRARTEYNAFLGITDGTEDLSGHADEMANKRVDTESLDEAIGQLKQYVNEPEVQPLVRVLEAMRADPLNGALVSQLAEAFDALGPRQGAVLTYAPSVIVLLSADPFNR